ncbi:serine/threonine-protein phosphatase 7 long form [Dorcoceras hygrometricum]|uniref:Serine/threonine-protein phosphatase 7 long form n=1 Tax=Dorcoceras hygrometricum TaxID=472368 RepID=A0A2Z7A5X6_9LAMI|nr:serine/threonine-protein phosphatase 7 long form [Dorcoceras hygrometricum]
MAVSQKRPAAVDVELAAVVKNKRTTKGKPVVIAQEAVPLQIIEGTAAVPVEQPPVPKRKIQKRKRRLVLEAEDEIFDDQSAAEAATGMQEPVIENEQAVTEPAVGTVLVEPVVEKAPVVEPTVEIPEADTSVDRPSTTDDVDDIIQQVLTETAQLETTDEGDPVDEPDLNDRPVVTPSDTDEDELIIDAVTETGDAIDCVVGEPVDEEMDPVKGNPVTEQIVLTLADIDCLVKLREKVIDDVEKFFYSFSLKWLSNLKIDESYFAKEELVLTWAEAESTGVALKRKQYILLKYREMLLRKFFEARIIFTPGDGSSAFQLKILDQLSDIHSFVLEELKKETQAHGLTWKKTCCSKIFEGRPRDRGAVIARINTNTPSRCWIRTMLFVDGVWAVEPCADHWVKIPRSVVQNEVPRQRSYDDTLPSIIQSSGSVASNIQSSFVSAVSPVFVLEDNQRDFDHRTDSPIRFTSDDIPLDDTVDVQTTFPAVTADISTLLDSMKISLSQRMDDAQSDILSRLHTIERGLRDTMQDEYF